MDLQAVKANKCFCVSYPCGPFTRRAPLVPSIALNSWWSGGTGWSCNNRHISDSRCGSVPWNPSRYSEFWVNAYIEVTHALRLCCNTIFTKEGLCPSLYSRELTVRRDYPVRIHTSPGGTHQIWSLHPLGVTTLHFEEVDIKAT